jgi:hypothetical protein
MAQLGEHHHPLRHRGTGRSTWAFDEKPYAITDLASDAVAVLERFAARSRDSGGRRSAPATGYRLPSFAPLGLRGNRWSQPADIRRFGNGCKEIRRRI